MQNELKPCPFCGAKSELCMEPWDFEKREPAKDAKYVVECGECLSRTDTYNSEDEAIEAWNRRTDND
ncbi:MAG: Lar family restriction alleviation protein [Oscillospiraceae bacterium]|nr:Lar family restriction alleviation protein [Oscillospiraceae bacterium]